MKVLLVGLNAKFIHSSLALYSLRASCLAAGQAAEIAEYTINQEFLHVLGDIAGRNPALVGIACYIWNRDLALKLAGALKKVLPTIRIVLGGPEASGDAAALLQSQPAVDFVVQGEGEQSLPELLAQLRQGGGGTEIAGVAARQDGKVVLNGGVRLVDNLDDLPFAYSAEGMAELANRIVYYESSRGCPFSCSYCVSSTTQGVRYRSVKKVKEELRFFLQQGVKQVKFVDRTFNVRPEHYREIWRFLAQNAATTNFHFEIVVDRLDAEDVHWLGQVAPGCFQFEIGVQSTCPETLAAIGRRNDWERIRENVKELQKTGNIHLHLDLIVGLPQEDGRRFRQSFNDVYNLQPDLLQIGFLKLLPGTRIRQEAAEYGYVWLDQPPYEILANDKLTYPEVRQLKQLEEVFNQTYNSGRFSYALKHWIALTGDDAFGFYQELASWWERQGLLGRSHSPEGVLSRLLEFAGRLPPGLRSQVGELLKLETLLDTTGALKGEALNWNGNRWERQKTALWRNESALRRYIPHYRFTNWRDVKRNYPIEVFETGVIRALGQGGWPAGQEPAVQKPAEQHSATLFDRTLRRTAWVCMPWDEFLAEDGR